ncbi:MAG: 30S ribosomal protein S16 [Wenyingzhuangia sp.]|mgnify:CR=1 FL=1|jgi:small subunit ribosomal protein S16|uniref:30S ribosomal protein S16 n=1 Tax=Wenyingzhuangia sp. TaxID=1964193 RepID=UPI00321A9647
MSVKIRLQRHGKKGKPFYYVVAADARSKRDGKYLEKLGTYNPNVNPVIIELDVDASVKWLNNGAQPTDTAKTILSTKGVLLKKHLQGGVIKGALTEEQAEAKFTAWIQAKEAAIQAKKDGLSQSQADERAKALEAEKAVSDARIAAVKEAEAALIAEAEAAEAAKQAEAEAATESEETTEVEEATE